MQIQQNKGVCYMKKYYNSPVVDIVKFNTPDIMVVSGNPQSTGVVSMTSSTETFKQNWLHD